MAYLKLPLVVRDYALGFQTINQARDNADQLFTDIGVRHGKNYQPTAYPWSTAGRHNDKLIPRGVTRIDVSVVYQGTTPTWYTITNSPGVIIGAVRFGTGNYFFGTHGLGVNQWADVCVQGGSSAPRFANCRDYLLANQYPGFLVQLYVLDAGAFTADDFSFSLRLRSMNT